MFFNFYKAELAFSYKKKFLARFRGVIFFHGIFYWQNMVLKYVKGE